MGKKCRITINDKGSGGDDWAWVSYKSVGIFVLIIHLATGVVLNIHVHQETAEILRNYIGDEKKNHCEIVDANEIIGEFIGYEYS